jgi:hypothetical protein
MVRGEQREGVGILHVGKTAKAAAIAVAVERAGVTEWEITAVEGGAKRVTVLPTSVLLSFPTFEYFFPT